MKTIVQKPLMIKINKLCLRNFDNCDGFYILSRIVPFQYNMKWVEKALCVAVKDSAVLKNISTANTQSALV